MIGKLFRFLWRWLWTLIYAALTLVILLIAPVIYIEGACRPQGTPMAYTSLLPKEHHRDEARTYLTYPEWHIVHAYDDYAEVIRTDDPHVFDFSASIIGFWSSLCTLSKTSGEHGGFAWETKQMVYVIGVSFTAEMIGKGLYEETFGRISAMMRGPDRAALDDLSAVQARAYADFLTQVPWYKWDFEGDAQALRIAAATTARDRERSSALGTEYRLKASYAKVIAQAVESVGADELTLRMIVTDFARKYDGVSVVGTRPEGTELETPRYRDLTTAILDMADEGVNFVEIAGNDDIMMTAIAGPLGIPGAKASFRRQGYDDFRYIIGVKVKDLGETLRRLADRGIRVEHIHDY